MDYQRGPRSHLRWNGSPKVSFQLEVDAKAMAEKLTRVTGRRQVHYLCDQNPSHWHVGGDARDLQEVKQ